MADLPSGTVTFLFTDVEGSTKLLHELGAEAYAEALAEHRRLVREACAARRRRRGGHAGRRVLLRLSHGAGSARSCGGDDRGVVFGPIQVRIGLHTGTPLLTEEGYVGDDVHFAARIAAAGHGGQVLLSAATAELVELELADLGEHRLKDIPSRGRDLSARKRAFPPLKTISNTNLPRPASSFVGRETTSSWRCSRDSRTARASSR